MDTVGRLALAAFIAVVVAAAGLALWSSGRDRDARDAAAPDAVSGELVVSAAASLTEAFEEVAAAFEAEHPGVEVVLNLGGSSALAEQIRGGAPADVFASADVAQMGRLEAGGDVGSVPTTFATNELRLAVPTDGKAGVDDLQDLRDTSLVVGLCAAEVPCGAYARELLSGAGLDPDEVADTLEPDVRSLLTKIALGELDAGITYATDVAAAGDDVTGIDVGGPAASYPIAVLWDAPNPTTATAFVDFVTGDDGRAILAEHGFGAAP